ncbi:MAG TPA: TlpA disulfide reductase family protein [Chloroflexota bacterium]|nr:TlpA disulfide reductase family protein [Chloroflexota bacterium]
MDSLPPAPRQARRGFLPAAIAFVVVALLGLLFYGLTSQRLGTGVTPNPNSLAPDFSLQTYDGKTVHLADLRGKTVVVNFWASWCVPCRDEQPILNDLAKQYAGKNVTFVGVNIQDKQADALAYLQATGVGYPVVVDPQGAVYINYGVVAVPETYVITPQGTIKKKFAAPIQGPELAAVLEDTTR